MAANQNSNAGMLWCIGIGVALLLLGGMVNSNESSKTPTKSELREWCESHGGDRFTSFNDPEVRRYMHDCQPSNLANNP